MKINEISDKKKIDEGVAQGLSDLSTSLIGQHATSAIKGMFTGAGTKATLAQDIFLKDFYSDALISIKNGISSGVIDSSQKMTNAEMQDKTDVTGKESPMEPQNHDKTQSSQKIKNPGAAARPGAAGGSQKPEANVINQQYGQATASMRNLKSGTKILPDTMINSLSNDIKNARYNKDWAINTANKITKLAQKVYDVSALKKSWDMATAIGRKQNTVQEHLYQQLNVIFEGIIREQTTGAKSLGDYMLEWFGMYMAGTNWQSYKPKIIQLCKNIEDNYPKGNWKDAIRMLGKAAYTIPGSGEASGAKNAAGDSSNNTSSSSKFKFGADQGSSNGMKTDSSQLKAMIANMPKAEREQLLKSIQNIK